MEPENPELERHKRDAQRLLREGWEPYPFVVGALARKGTSWPAVHVAPYLWEAMRDLIDEAKSD
jgi:hypothetical protein